MVFGIGKTAFHHTIGLVLGVCCTGVKCLYFVSSTDNRLDGVFPLDDPWFGTDAEYNMLHVVTLYRFF